MGRISLNRPQVLNAYNIQMRDDLAQALEAVQEDPEVRSLLITGEGRAFCAGADLSEFGSAPSQAEARRVRWERDVFGQLLGLSKAVVVAVHGYCIGSGVEILLLCDIRISAADTIFALPEVQLGMVPAAGGTQTLPRSVGPSRALDLALTGRRWDAKEALAMGLLTRVAPEHGLMDEALRVARQLAALDGNLVAAAKESLRRGAGIAPSQGPSMEAALALRALT